MPPKTIQDMMGEMTDPATIEMNAKYQNARDAVSWAYKMTVDIFSLPGTITLAAPSIAAYARELTPLIEADLNKTLEVLREGSGGK